MVASRTARRRLRSCSFALWLATQGIAGLLTSKPALGAAPPPARSSSVLVLAGPDHAVTGELASIELVLTTGSDSLPSGLRLAANVGHVGEPRAIGAGRWAVTYTLPEERHPQVALVAALAPASRTVAEHRIELSGTPTIELRSEPRVLVRVQVGKRSVGSVTTDRNGRAKLAIVVPPGLREVSTFATDQYGNVTQGTLTLATPPFPRVLSLCSTDEQAVYVLALNEQLGPAQSADFSLAVRGAVASPAQRLRPGLFRVALRADAQLAPATELSVQVSLAGQEQRCTLPSRPPEPDSPSASAAVPSESVTWIVGARLGASSNFARVAGPWGGLSVAYSLAHVRAGLRLEADLAYSHSTSDLKADTGEHVDLTVDVLPILAGARYVWTWGDLQASLAAQLGTAFVQAAVNGASTSTKQRSLPPWFGGSTGLGLQLWRGEATLELGYAYAELADAAIQGNVAGLRATLGYFLHL